jgi:hypothetical protein
VKFCKLSRLKWAGHVIRQDDDDLSRRVLLSEPGRRRPRGRPNLRWEDGVVEDVARLGCKNCPKPGGMDETLEGGRGPPRAVAPLERERERYLEKNLINTAPIKAFHTEEPVAGDCSNGARRIGETRRPDITLYTLTITRMKVQSNALTGRVYCCKDSKKIVKRKIMKI